VQNKIMIVVGG